MPRRAATGRGWSLWDSYNFDIAVVSKTYAPDGTSSRNGSGVRLRATLVRPPREYFMWDVVMLALGLGFFVVAIGYTYACERL